MKGLCSLYASHITEAITKIVRKGSTLISVRYIGSFLFFIFYLTSLNAIHIPHYIFERNLLMLGNRQDFFIQQLKSGSCSIAPHPRKNLIAVAYAEERPLELYSFQDDQLIRVQTVTDHNELLNQSVATRWSYTGEYLAVGNFGQSTTIYRLGDDQQLSFLCQTDRPALTSSVAWSKLGTFLCTTNFSGKSYIYLFDPLSGMLLQTPALPITPTLCPLFVGWGKTQDVDEGFCIQDLYGKRFICSISIITDSLTVTTQSVTDFRLFVFPRNPRMLRPNRPTALKIDCPETVSDDECPAPPPPTAIDSHLDHFGADEAVLSWLAHLSMPDDSALAEEQHDDREITGPSAPHNERSSALFALAHTPLPSLRACSEAIRRIVQPDGWAVVFLKDTDGNTALHVALRRTNIYFLLALITATPSIQTLKALLRNHNRFFQSPYSIASVFKRTLPGSIIYRATEAVWRITRPDIHALEILATCRDSLTRFPGLDALLREIDELIAIR